MELKMTSIVGARLYVGYGEFPSSPDPLGKQYYGWIEFTKKHGENIVWVNLSNVDMIGLPLALAGTDNTNRPFTLGYKKSINTIISDIAKNALKQPYKTNAAYIKCDSGHIKIAGPNRSPESYPSYRSYINSLNKTKARLVITSDTPKNGSAELFTGGFTGITGKKEAIISLKSGSNTIVLKNDQFNSKTCYECGGGTLIYNGHIVEQNQLIKKNDPQKIKDNKMLSNSTFRNILIGINEGYFTPNGSNRSSDFGGLIPFAKGNGNKYAQALHETSNSYGFPYADSNLKTLIMASPDDMLTMTICKDYEAKGYQKPDENTANIPRSGDYSFGIGEHSQHLGMIKIGGWRYPTTPKGAYGGILPTVSEWTKMEFTGPGKHIWFKTTGTGEIHGKECFKSEPSWVKKKLTWGADIKWKDGASSPDKPTS